MNPELSEFANPEGPQNGGLSNVEEPMAKQWQRASLSSK
jgi:hypothetical protein